MSEWIEGRAWQLEAALRKHRPLRYWHIALCALSGSVLFWIVDYTYLYTEGRLTGLKEIWWLTLLAPLLCGMAITLGAGGASLGKRILCAALGGGLLGFCSILFAALFGKGGLVTPGQLFIACVWRMFVFTILSAIGAILTEIKLPEPKG